MYLEMFAVFCAMAATDAFWTLYFLATNRHEAIKASFWSAMIIVCSSFSTLSIVENKYNIIAATFGAFFGTYFVVQFDKIRKTKHGDMV